jgi:hypothetical protein
MRRGPAFRRPCGDAAACRKDRRSPCLAGRPRLPRLDFNRAHPGLNLAALLRRRAGRRLLFRNLLSGGCTSHEFLVTALESGPFRLSFLWDFSYALKNV